MPPGASTIGDLFVRLGVDATALERGFGSAEKRIESFGTRLYFLGSRVSIGFTAPVLTAIGAVGKWGLDFDKAMTESLAIMDHVTPAMRAQMEGVAKDVASTTKFSAAEAAGAYYSLASAGLNAAESIKALPVAARFAQAGNFDMAKSTEFLAAAQAAMGKQTATSAEKIEDMARIADVLTEANNRALGTVQDFAEALTNKAGNALRLTHKSIEEGVAVLAVYASQGIKGKVAGEQLAITLRDLTTHAIKHAAAFKAAGISVFDASNKMRNMADVVADLEKATAGLSDKQTQQLIISLGIPARSIAATKALIGYSGAIRENQAALEAAGGATQRVADQQMKSLSNQLLQLWHQFQITAINIFQDFIPVIKDYLIPGIMDALKAFQAFAHFLTSLPEPVKAAAAGFIGFVAAIGPFVTFLGSTTLLFASATRGLQGFLSILGKSGTMFGLAVGGGKAARITFEEVERAAEQVGVEAYNAAKAQGVLGFWLNKTADEAKANALAQGRLIIAQQEMADGAGLMARAYGLLTNPLTITAGLITGVGAAILITQQYTQDWGETIKVWLVPGYGMLDLLKSLGARLAEQPGVWGDLGRVIRDVASIMLDDMNKALDTILNKLKSFGDDAVAAIAGAGSSIVTAWAATIEKLGSLTPGGQLMFALTVGWQETKRELEEVKQKLKELADQADRVAKYNNQDIGRFNVKFSQNLLTSNLNPAADLRKNFAQSNPVQIDVPFQLKPVFEQPAGGMGGTDPESPTKAFVREVQKVKEQLLGTGGNDLRVLQAAWASAMKETKGAAADSLPALEQLWKEYRKIKDETGAVVPAFETLLAQFIRNEDEANKIKYTYSTFTKSFSDLAVEVDQHSAQIITDMAMMNKAQRDATFEHYAKGIEELIPLYDSLDGNTQQLIDTFIKWDTEVGHANQFTEANAKAVLATSDAIDTYTAKLVDSREAIEQFGDAGGRTFRNLRQRQEARMTSDLQIQLRKRLQAASTMRGQDLLDELGHINDLRQAGEAYITSYTREQTLKYLASIGTNKKILREEQKYTQAELDEIAKRQNAWNLFITSFQHGIGIISAAGNIASSLHLDDLSTALSSVSSGLGTVLNGIKLIHDSDTLTGTIEGWATAISGVVQAFAGLSQVGSRSIRALGGALSGMMTGAAIGEIFGFGPAGGIVGGIIGGLVGLFMKDPGWKKAQNTVKALWNENISKGLAQQIDNDAKMLGGHVNSMLLHLSDIAAENGGLSAANVGDYASKLAMTFNLVEQGHLSTANAAKILDANFENLTKAGMTANGILNDQVIQLVTLERQYKTGSQAIKDFTNAQLGMAGEGLNEIAAGLLGPLTGGQDAIEKTTNDIAATQEKIDKLKAQIADYEKKGVSNEKQRVALQYARIDLAKQENKLAQQRNLLAQENNQIASFLSPDDTGPTAHAQEQFDRLGRLAKVTFDAMVASGTPVTEALKSIGATLDILSDAQSTLKFHTDDAVQSLLAMNQFAKDHPELVGMVDGLNKAMQGLTNTGFMTEQTFNDLGDTAADTFDSLVANGLTADQTYGVMHQTLQTLWELQQKYHFELDDTTQALLDNAAASGTVGEKYMSANDRMVLGIQTLIDRFDLFLKHLGIDVPKAADDAAKAVQSKFDGVHPDIEVRYHYKQHGDDLPTEGNTTPPDIAVDRPPREVEGHDLGGIVTRPHIAVVHTNEAIMPINQLWNEMDQLYGQDNQTPTGKSVVIQEGGIQVTVTAPYVTTQAEWIAKDITRGVLESLGGNDEPGYQSAVESIVKRVLEKHR